MSHFKSVDPYLFSADIFEKIGKEWFLLTAADASGKHNGMTASWGGVGVLWNMPVCFLFVRKNRYTHGFIGKGSALTLSFLSEKEREALYLYGKRSGRDTDKEKESRLHPFRIGGGVSYEEAKLIITATPLYESELTEEGFYRADEKIFYEKEPYHTVFICRIDEILERIEK